MRTPYTHHGSHVFLVDDFVVACTSRKRPAIDVYQAARYLVPGLIAHESAVRRGNIWRFRIFGAGD